MEFPYLNGDGFLKSRYLFMTVPTTLLDWGVPDRAYQDRSFAPHRYMLTEPYGDTFAIECLPCVEIDIGQVPSGIPLDLLTQMVFLDIGKWDLLYECKTLPS
jgi:hypothetical protein